MPLASLPGGCEPACHGCRHRLRTAEESIAQKTAYLAQALHPWADRIQPAAVPVESERLGYRDRVTLNAGWSAAHGWQFGLMRRDQLIPIPDCPVHTQRVRALVHLLMRQLPPGDRLPLAYLHVAGAQATLIVKARNVDDELLAPLLGCIPGTGIEGLWLHLHPAAGRRLFGRSGWRLLWGAAESRGPGGLVHGPTAFMQPLPGLYAAAVDEALHHLEPGASIPVLDLYSGVGATLREWTRAGSAVLGVELSGEAVACAIRNAPAAAVLRGTCAQRLPQVRGWWRDVGGEGVVFVNPPRSGLEAEVTQALTSDLRPARIAYLSCSAGALARDLMAFDAAGFGVRSIRPYDFFPNTHHVEALALVERR